MIGSALACALWGYFLYQGVIDPLGGIWTMWPLFGTANQMLAAIALMLCTVVLFKMKREQLRLGHDGPDRVAGGLHGDRRTGEGRQSRLRRGLRQPRAAVQRRRRRGQDASRRPRASSEMGRIVFNDYVDGALAALFVAIVLAMVVYGVIEARKALRSARTTAVEIGGAMVAAE